MAYNPSPSTLDREQSVSWRDTLVHYSGQAVSVLGSAAQKAGTLSKDWIYDPLADRVGRTSWQRTAAVIRGTGNVIETCGEAAKILGDAIQEDTQHDDIGQCEIRVGVFDRSWVLKKGSNAREEVAAFVLPGVESAEDLPALSPILAESEIAAQESAAAIQQAREATDAASDSFVRLTAAFCTFKLVLKFLPDLALEDQDDPAFEMTRFVNEEDSLREIFENYLSAKRIDLSFMQTVKVQLLFLLTEHYIHQCLDELACEVKELVRNSLSDREKFSRISKKFLKNFSNFFEKCLQEIARKNMYDADRRVPGLNTEHLMAQFHQEHSDFFPIDDTNVTFTNPKEIYELFARNIHTYLPAVSFKDQFLDYCHIQWSEEVQAENEATLRKITEVALSVFIAIPLVILTFFDWIANEYIIPMLIDEYLPDLVEDMVNAGLNNVGTNNYSYALTTVFREQVESTIEKLSQPEDLAERGADVEVNIIDPAIIQTFVGKLLAVIDQGVFEDEPESRWMVSDIGTSSLLTHHLSKLFSYLHRSMTQKTHIEELLTKFLGVAIKPFQEGRIIEPGVLNAEKDLAKAKTTELVRLLTDSGSYEKIWGVDEADQRKLIDRFIREVFRKPVEKDLKLIYERLQHIHFHLNNPEESARVQFWLGQMHQCLQDAAEVVNERYEATKNIPNLPTKFKEHLRGVKERLVVQTNQAIQTVSNIEAGNLGLEELHGLWSDYNQLNGLWENVHSAFTAADTTKPVDQLLQELTLDRVQEIRRFLNRISELTTSVGENIDFTLGVHEDDSPEQAGFIDDCEQVLDSVQYTQHSRRALEVLREFSPNPDQGDEAISPLDQIVNYHRVKLEEDQGISQVRQVHNRFQRSVSFAVGYQRVLRDEELQGQRTEFLEELRANIHPDDAHRISILFQRLAAAQSAEHLQIVADELKETLANLIATLQETQQDREAEITRLLERTREGRTVLLKQPDEDLDIPDAITCLKTEIRHLSRAKADRVDEVLVQMNQMQRTLFEIQNPKVFQLGLSTVAQVGLAYYSLPYLGAFYIQQALALPGVWQKGVEQRVKNLSARGVSEYYSQSITNYVRRALELSEQRVVSTAVLSMSAHTVNQLIATGA